MLTMEKTKWELGKIYKQSLINRSPVVGGFTEIEISNL